MTLVAESSAQSAPTEWTGVGKIKNGSCGDGSLLHVRETAGGMNLRFTTVAGQPFANVEIALASDGSAQAQFQGFLGATTLEIPPGNGKRAITTKLVYGRCRWLWAPN